jgi:glycosyltransferase involved in cell wall biosynthesis
VVPALKDRGFTVVSLVHELPNLIQEYGLQEACRNIADRSDHVVFSSSMGRGRFCEGFPVPAERSFIRAQGLYSEITLSAWARDRVAAELGLPAECRIVVGIGYGDLRKGVDLFVRAAFALKDHPLAPQFVWVGALDPAVRTWLASDVQRAGIGNLHFVGQRSNVSDYLSAADVLLLTSREDPYPTVVMEALAAGVPVMAFRECGGFVELLDDPDFGQLIPFGDLEVLVATVISVCRQPENEREAKRALRISLAKERFDFRKYAFHMLQLVRKGTEAVSVIVPNYNYAEYLEARLASISNQSYPICELIVLDDASTDDSMAVLSAFRERTGIDWKLIAGDTNSGNVFRQWKRGVEAASGDLVWIAEVDDLSFSGFIERLAGLFARHPDVSFAFCDSVAIDRHGQVMYEGYQGYYDTVEAGCFSEDRVWAGREFLSKYLAVKNLILNASSVIWRRNVLLDAFARVGADLFDYRVAGDWRLYVEAANFPGSVGFCATPLNVHRRHARSVTHSLDERRHYDEICRVQNAAARYLGTDAGLAAKIDAYRKEIRGYFRIGEDVR